MVTVESGSESVESSCRRDRKMIGRVDSVLFGPIQVGRSECVGLMRRLERAFYLSLDDI